MLAESSKAPKCIFDITWPFGGPIFYNKVIKYAKIVGKAWARMKGPQALPVVSMHLIPLQALLAL